MKNIICISVTALVLLTASDVKSQISSGTADNQGTTLTDKFGIRIFETFANGNNNGTLNFTNSTDKNTIIMWNVLDNGGRASYTGGSMTLAPHNTVSIPVNSELKTALAAKDSSIQFILKN